MIADYIQRVSEARGGNHDKAVIGEMEKAINTASETIKKLEYDLEKQTFKCM